MKLCIKQIHAYVGLSDGDWIILVLCWCLMYENLVSLLWLFPHEGSSEMTCICVVESRITIQMGYVRVYTSIYNFIQSCES